MIDDAMPQDLRTDALARLRERLPRFREDIEDLDSDRSLAAGVEALLLIYDKCGPSGIRDLLQRDIHPKIGFFSQGIEAKPLSDDPSIAGSMKAIFSHVAKDINYDLLLFNPGMNESREAMARREMLMEMFYVLTGGTIAGAVSLPSKKELQELNQREHKHGRWRQEESNEVRRLRRRAHSVLNVFLGGYVGYRTYAVSTGKLSSAAAFLKAPLVSADSRMQTISADDVLQSASRALEKYLYPEKNRTTPDKGL